MTAWENTWNLNADEELMGNPDFARFKLVLHGSGNFKYYLVENEEGELGAPWKNCCLVARGNTPLIYNSHTLLRPWNPRDAVIVAAYNLAIDQALGRTSSETNRLECELDFAGAKRWAKLFMLRNAVDNGSGVAKDLLIVNYGRKFKWSAAGPAAPIEDGTGHGNSL